MEDISLLNKSFFRIVDTCLHCEDIARQSCAMVPCRWRLLASFCVLYFHRAACSTFQTCILSSPYAIVPLSVLSCLSVCDVGITWPNGWMDQDETWHGDMPRPRPHCVRWGPSSSKGHSPHFSAHVCCGQTAGWMKMPFGTEVGVS